MKKIFTKRLTTLLALVLCTVAVLANNKNYKSTVKAIANPSAAGKVYVSVSNGTNGSEGATSTATKTENTSEAPSHSYTLKATTTDNGYSWQGWYTKENGGGTRKSTSQTYSGFSVTAAEGDGKTETLYAYWTANTYTVTFDGNEGTPSATSKSVTYASTYGDLATATRRFYDFDGWYTGKTDGSKVTSSTKVTAKSNHTLYAHWTLHPEDQTLSWNEGIQFNMAKGSRQPIAVTATSGLETFTYESSKTDVIAIDGEYLVAVGNGEAEITVRQAGNDFYNAASLKATFTVMSKETPFFSENGFSADGTNELKVGDRVTLSVDKVSEGLDGDFTISANTADVMDIAREGNVITFSALHEGAVTITVSQAENEDIYAASKEYTFNVTRYVPEFVLSNNSLELEQIATLTLRNTEGAAIAFNPAGIVSYDGSTGTITATAVGTTTLTISQAETNSVQAKDSTFEITVSKKNPTLTVKMNGEERTTLSIMQGRTATVAFESNSEGNLTVSNVRGSQYASYINGTMTAGAVGEAVYRVTLDETDTFKGTYKDFTLTVTKDQDAVPVSGKSYTLGHGEETDWRGESATLHFNGVPDKLNFKYVYNYRSDLGKTSLKCPDYLAWSVDDSKEGKNNVYMLFVEESPDNVNWTMIWNNSDPFKDNPKSIEQPITLQKTTRYVRFNHTANFSSTYSDISISELKFVDDPNPNTIDFGSAVINSGEVTKTSIIQWCNIAPLSVTCANPRFKVTPSTIGNFGTYGTTEIQITYTHTGEESDEQADVVISNGTYSKSIHVSAKTIKRPQTITWNNDLSSTGFAMNVDEQYPDASILAIATSTNGGRVTFTSDNDTVVKVVADTALLAVGIGNANITAHQAGDAEYQEVSDTKKFTVTLKQKQSITWNQTFYDLLTTSGSRELNATATSGGEIKYTSANPAVVSIDGNILTVVGEGETYITATQEGGVDSTGIDWLEVSQSNYVVVRDPNSECSGVMLSVGSLTLSSSKKEQVYTLSGIPASITFKAKHGTKTGSWGTTPSYSSLLVDEYAYIDGQLDWHNVFEKVVGTDEATYGANGTIKLSKTATKIRVRTLETGTDHTITNLQVTYSKYLTPDIKQVNTDVESNSTWKQKIVVSHSNIDFISVYTTSGLLNLSESTIGEGCYDYTDDEFVASFTPAIKNQEYRDTIVITDRKTNPSTVLIPVRLYSKGLNQSISGFELPTTALTTEEINVAATATSGLEVSYKSSNDKVAYVADGKLVILSDGEVTITAMQEGNEKYDAAPDVEQTIVISKTPTSITTAPTAATLTYGQTLSESALSNGAGSVDGEFVWEAPQTVPASGTPTYTVVFVPTQSKIYATATTLVSVRVEKATPAITTYPTAGDITIAQKVGDSQLTGGVATVEGTFAWKNPEERRLHPGEYTRTVVFTPADNNYNTVEITVSFQVVNVLAKITELPEAIVENAIYGMTLADVTLEGGSANVAGSFAWADEATILLAGTHDYTVVFTPEDLEFYSPCSAAISITAAKVTPVIETLPKAAGITYGDKLAASELSEGAGSVEGTFAWKDGEQLFAVGEYEAGIVFVPADADNYNSVEDIVTVTVEKTELKVVANDTVIVYGQNAPAFTASYIGLVNGESAEVLGGVLGFECEYASGMPVGEYGITPSGLTAENYSISFVSGILKVNKAVAEVTVLPTATEIYVGQKLSASTLSGGEAITEGTFTWAVPTTAPSEGTSKYPVVFIPFDTDNYTSSTVMVDVTATKVNVYIMTYPQADETLVYTGESQVLITAGEAFGGTMLYSLDGENYSTELPQGTDAKTYTVYYKVEPTIEGGEPIAPATIEVTIDEAVPHLMDEPLAIAELVYNGEEQTLITAGTVMYGTLLYSLDGIEFSTELPTGKDAKTYHVYFNIEGDENYMDMQFGTPVVVTIAKADVELTAPVAYETLAYTGEDQELITAGEVVGGTLLYSADGEEFSTVIPTGKEIGNYTVYYRVDGDENHNDVAMTAIEVSIAQPRAELTVAPTAIAELVYDGNAHTLIVAGEAVGGELQYSLDNENFATDLPEGTNATTYTVYYKVAGDENHSDLVCAPIEVTIAKVALSVTAEGKETTYGVEAPAFTVAYEGFIGEETEAVLGGELAFACEYAAGSNVGEYTITPSGLTAENYEISFVDGTLTVAKAALNVTAEDKQTTYGVEAPAFTVAFEGFFGEDNAEVLTGELGFACEYAIGSNVGEYIITPSGLTAENYKITFGNGTLTVAKAALSVTAENKETTYGAEAPAFTVAFEGFIAGEDETVLGGELAFACEYTVGSNAGEYTITPSGLTANNYELTFGDGILNVAKAALSVTAENKETTYGLEAPEFTAVIEGFIGEENAEVLAGELAFNCEYAVGSNAGKYTITPSGLTADNYEIAFINGTLNVAKADVELVAPEAKANLYYTGEALELITAGEVIGGEIQYSFKSNKDYSTTIPTAVEIGYYRVYYRVVGDQNHNDVAKKSIFAQILGAQATITVEPAAAEGLVYTGKPQTLLATAGEAEGGNLLYSLDGEAYSTSVPVATNAGEYTVYYRVASDANHSNLDPATLTVTIAKAEQTIVWDQDLTTIEVGGFIELHAQAALTVTFTSDDELIARIDDGNILRAEHAGVVTITATQEGNNNYLAAEPVTKEIIILPGTTTMVEESRSQVKVTKIIRNDQVLIIRDGRTYNAAGVLVE